MVAAIAIKILAIWGHLEAFFLLSTGFCNVLHVILFYSCLFLIVFLHLVFVFFCSLDIFFFSLLRLFHLVLVIVSLRFFYLGLRVFDSAFAVFMIGFCILFQGFSVFPMGGAVFTACFFLMVWFFVWNLFGLIMAIYPMATAVEKNGQGTDVCIRFASLWLAVLP